MVFYFACKNKEKEGKKEHLPAELEKYFFILASKCEISVTKTLFCHLEKAKFP